VHSPSLGKVIGLVYLAPSASAISTRFEIRIDKGQMVGAEVVATPFYDPENKRQEL